MSIIYILYAHLNLSCVPIDGFEHLASHTGIKEGCFTAATKRCHKRQFLWLDGQTGVNGEGWCWWGCHQPVTEHLKLSFPASYYGKLECRNIYFITIRIW